MNIGIKYCGGCNPRYNRSGFITELKKRYAESVHIESVKTNIEYNLILVVCGCSSRCVNLEDREYNEQVIFVSCEADFPIVYERIDKFIMEE